jgi:hypothetical protein
MKHPGTPILYDINKPVAKGGLPFRANWGVEHNGQTLLAADGSANRDSELDTGYPEFDHVFLKKLGWWSELTPQEQAMAEGKNWKTDNSGGIIRVVIAHGCAPYGNARARANVWNFPDPVPTHREPLMSPRRDLVAKYPTYDDKANFLRLPTLYKSVQEVDFSKDFPMIMTSGRAAAEHVRRGQSEGRGPAGREAGRLRLDRNADRCTPENDGDGHRAGAGGDGLGAVPLRRLVDGRGSRAPLSRRRGADGTRRSDQHRVDLWLRRRHDDAGNQGFAVPPRARLMNLDRRQR